jgi:glycosyltransferase involved in cell wall biosynthesis
MKISISIIVPAHNEGSYIAKSLSSIQNCCVNYSGKTEIIVVDNHSSDNTNEIASTFDVNVIRSIAKTPSKVRNDGAALAQYEIFAFVDGDCEVNGQWLELINKAYQDTSVGAYGGQHIAPLEDNSIVTSWNPTSLKSSLDNKGKLPGGNFSIRSSLFKQIGGFNEQLTSAEDDHLSKQVLLANFKCVLDSNNYIVHWGYPKTLAAVFAKQKWHGKTQIKAHGYFGDKLVLVTYAWLLAIMTTFIGVISDVKLFTVFGVLGLFFGPLIILMNRLKYHHHIKWLNIPVGYLVALFFIAGRLTGLVLECIDIVMKSKKIAGSE